MTIVEKALGLKHPNVLTVLECLSDLYRKTDRIEEAQSLEERVRQIRAMGR
jgi:hypothetical protein